MKIREWKSLVWGDIATLEYGKGLKDYLRQDGKFPVYGTNGKIGTTDAYLCPLPGVIVGRKGAYRGIHYSPSPFFVIDTAFFIKPKNNDLDLKYAYYQLKTIDIDSMDSGSAIPSTSREDFYGIEINLPPINQQRAIAEVLSSLDDKIDLLHRQNKTLESLAQTLFRQWFIEEADGQIGKLGDVIELRYGKGLKEEVRTGQGFPVVGSSGIVGYHSEYLVEGPGIVIGRKGTLGRVVYIYENFFPIDTTYFVKSKTESDGLLYEYFLLQTLNFEEMNSDSAVPGLNRDIALATEVRIPSPDLRNDFNYQCSLLFQKKKRNTGQIDVLAGLRDSLLPKLMSGEITCG